MNEKQLLFQYGKLLGKLETVLNLCKSESYVNKDTVLALLKDSEDGCIINFSDLGDDF